MRRALLFLLLLVAVPSLFGAVTIVNGPYSNINQNARQYRVYYPAGTAVSAKLPVVVIIHGGGWWKGTLSDSAITPPVCNDTTTIACWLAESGFAVYSINYTLVSPLTANDLTITSANTVQSASHAFNTADVGSALIVQQGNPSGWNVDGYKITSVAGGAATLSASPGATGLTHGGYSLVQGSTLWPAQWQDCNCFLRYLAETLGVSAPGDPHNIYLFGHSAGGQLAGVVGLGGSDIFPTNCDHVSTNYTIRGIVAASPPTDLITLYQTSTISQSDIRNFLGCIPGYGSCNQVAATASITNYIAENLPPYVSFSGGADVGVPPANAEEASLAFLKLSPPVISPWWNMGPTFNHDLDLLYYNPCSLDPDAGSEPSPCGSAGNVFAKAMAFMQPLETYAATLTVASGNYQSISAGVAAASALAVSVLDQNGHALPGATVTFSVVTGTGGEGGTFNGAPSVTVVTGSDGTATAPALIVNTVPGPFTVTASANGASTSFSLNIGSIAPPFGSLDTPANNTSGIAGAIGVTGWALSPVGIQNVGLWRDPIPAEGTSLIFLGNAAIIPGSRPDVATVYPGYPCNNCGWGAQVLTNELPNTDGVAGIGNGTYNLHALVTDNVGQTVDIGIHSIGAANAGSLIPFGTIDTPAQGQTISGPAYVNFGWVLTPQPDLIPLDGSTIWVYIDNVAVGHPVYNNYRPDVATVFPGLQNSDGAVGIYYIDTTKLTNGIHSISWSVTDDAGHAQGIGSRFFFVQN